jgi:ArsR family transcriptional regulator, arsenate/arsenite/antimonite-responsive transcriptional repressor
MGITKSDIFSEKTNALANIFKAIGHPARLSIVEYIGMQNSCICGNLVDELGLAQSTISKHLSILKDADVIKGTISGSSICYCLNKELLSEIKSVLDLLSKGSSCC